MLAKEGVLEDIRLFQNILENRFSYFFLEHGDYKQALSKIRERAGKLDRSTFGNLLQKVLALFIDGHARMSDVLREEGDLPFRPVVFGDKVIAHSLDGTSFLDHHYPYLTKMDDKDIEEWIHLAHSLFPKSSSQFLRLNSVDTLKRIQHRRLESKQELKDTVEVELSDGEKTLTKRLEILKEPHSRLRRSRGESKFLEDNIGYLRLEKMNDQAVETIRRWLPVFKNTNGLIIDVRGNGGGSRAALRELFPYFMTYEESPVVASVAVYRLWKGFKNDLWQHATYTVLKMNSGTTKNAKPLGHFAKGSSLL
jgi:hypothetical protein